MHYKCVSSYYYNEAYIIYKYLNSRNILYKFDCNIHPKDGFQLFVLEENVDKVRREISYIESFLILKENKYG